MAVEQFWPRAFRMWHFSISRSTLVLRSLEPDISPGRVDVAFGGVETLCLPVGMGVLELKEQPPDEDLRPPYMRGSSGGRLFRVNGTHYVVARTCAWHEDDGDHHAPSPFGPLPGLEGHDRCREV